MSKKSVEDFATILVVVGIIGLFIWMCTWNLSCRRNALQRITGKQVSLWDTFLITSK